MAPQHGKGGHGFVQQARSKHTSRITFGMTVERTPPTPHLHPLAQPAFFTAYLPTHSRPPMTRKARVAAIVQYFEAHYKDPRTELEYANPYQLLVAVVLSAQCTDVRVNLTTPALFKRYPNPEALAQANHDELFALIKSISYPNNKTKHLLGLGKMLVEDFNSRVPENREELMKLPGVGRKTANVILSVVFEEAAIAVDTHVYRVSRRLGIVPQTAKTPRAVEEALIKVLPEDRLAVAHHWLILHGRYTCKARSPLCSKCGLTASCRYFTKLPAQGAS